ncbi:MAG TPA: glycosyl hydrolase family 28 protein [Sphingomonas sp.]|nr:glycosyl hydrolase family 28 protein [Sphingomonas sp.]
MIGRRQALGCVAALLATGAGRPRKVFDVRAFGAAGDGSAIDTRAIQRAIDAAAEAGGQVLLPRGTYLTGPVELRGGIDFHLAAGAEIRVSTRPEDYGDARGVLHATGAMGLSISGGGTIDGCSPAFMDGYDAENEWWIPKKFRPRLLVLEDCEDLTIRGVTFRRAPSWTVHLLGCRRVLIDGITIRNQLDVPNCDGIDPDHCQHVEIRNCRITCGDDAIVIKTTAGHDQYGPSHDITVRDCVLETQDSGLKIGTETVQDIHDILFERCRIVTSCRGLCIQLRDQGSVYNVTFRDIHFVARYHSAPWWGRGEAISFTAIPRNAQTRLGTIHDVLVQRVTGRAENSVRIEGSLGARIANIALDRVAVTLGRWTGYPGGVFDNRPTTAVEPIEKHDAPGFFIRHADHVSLTDCAVRWADDRRAGFTHALHGVDVIAFSNRGFDGESAHPEKYAAVFMQ